MIENHEIPVEDVTDQVFMAVALGDGMYQDTVRISVSGVGSMVLILLDADGKDHKQFKVSLATLCASLARDYMDGKYDPT